MKLITYFVLYPFLNCIVFKLCPCFLFRLLLLNQFHDVIPGSCIELVVKDALRYYEGTVFVQSHNACLLRFLSVFLSGMCFLNID